MQISHISFNNTKLQQLYKINNQDKTQTQSFLQPLPCDSVHFTGAQKEFSSEGDKAFLYAICKEFNLTEEESAKLKKTLSDFLEENHYESLVGSDLKEDIIGQIDLRNRIYQHVHAPRESLKYIQYEIQRRCDIDDDDYIPCGFKKYQNYEDICLKLVRERKSVKELEKDFAKNDNFYLFIKKLLRINSTEIYDLREFIDEYLENNNLGSLVDLYKDKQLIEEQKTLVKQIGEKFDLNEYEQRLLFKEFSNRPFNDDIDSNSYRPSVSIHSKDIPLLCDFLVRKGYKDNFGNQEFIEVFHKLYAAMCVDAIYNNCKTIFDIFRLKDKFEGSETNEFIKSSNLSEDQQMNLIIDLNDVANNYDKYYNRLPRYPQRDAKHSYARCLIIKNHILNEYGIRKNQAIEDDIMSILVKMAPDYIKGGQNTPSNEVAFKIADEYELPPGSKEEIENLINEVKGYPEDILEEYLKNNL